MNDVERLAAALRIANEELEVRSADLAEAAQSGRRRLIGRLIVVGLLSAVGATLLLTGGLTAPAAIDKIRNGSDSKGGDKTANDHPHKGDGGGQHGGQGGSGNGNGGGDGRDGQSSGGGNSSQDKKDRDKKEEKKEEEELPDLIVSRITPTEVVVENLSGVSADPFAIVVAGETTEHGQTRKVISFSEILGAGQSSGLRLPIELDCSGAVFAEVDYFTEVRESDEHDNEFSECTEPAQPSATTEEAGEAKKEAAGAKPTAEGEGMTKSPSTVGSSPAESGTP